MLTAIMVGMFIICGCVLSVVYSNPLSGQEIPSNNTQRVACLSDDMLSLYLSMGCQVTYSQDHNGCAAIDKCPADEPKDEKLAGLWHTWKSMSEENSSAGNPEAALKNNISILEKIQGSNETVVTESTTDATTTKAVTVSVIPRVTRRRDCLRYRRSALNLYKYMGCTITPSRGCDIVNDCPKECIDQSGFDHKLKSDQWFEGIQRCSCENIRSVRASVPRIPRGAPNFPPYKYCVTYGCILPENNQHVKPNEQVVRGNGILECVCREGPDPDVRDDAPPFHLACVQVR